MLFIALREPFPDVVEGRTWTAVHRGVCGEPKRPRERFGLLPANDWCLYYLGFFFSHADAEKIPIQ
jgi:hypothetical protein